MYKYTHHKLISELHTRWSWIKSSFFSVSSSVCCSSISLRASSSFCNFSLSLFSSSSFCRSSSSLRATLRRGLTLVYSFHHFQLRRNRYLRMFFCSTAMASLGKEGWGRKGEERGGVMERGGGGEEREGGREEGRRGRKGGEGEGGEGRGREGGREGGRRGEEREGEREGGREGEKEMTIRWP